MSPFQWFAIFLLGLLCVALVTEFIILLVVPCPAVDDTTTTLVEPEGILRLRSIVRFSCYAEECLGTTFAGGTIRVRDASGNIVKLYNGPPTTSGSGSSETLVPTLVDAYSPSMEEELLMLQVNNDAITDVNKDWVLEVWSPDRPSSTEIGAGTPIGAWAAGNDNPLTSEPTRYLWSAPVGLERPLKKTTTLVYPATSQAPLTLDIDPVVQLYFTDRTLFDGKTLMLARPTSGSSWHYGPRHTVRTPRQRWVSYPTTNSGVAIDAGDSETWRLHVWNAGSNQADDADKVYTITITMPSSTALRDRFDGACDATAPIGCTAGWLQELPTTLEEVE